MAQLNKSSVRITGVFRDIVEFLKDCVEVFGDASFHDVMAALASRRRTKRLIAIGYNCALQLLN